MDDPEIRDFAVQRRAYLDEVEALKLRLCRLCTLAVFAVEKRPENIDMCFKDLGFGVEVTVRPRWHSEAIFVVAISITIAALVPSFIYASVVDNFHIYVPPNLKPYAPVEPLDVFIWALMAAALHTLAIVVALMVKRKYAPKYTRGKSSDTPENEICAASSYLCCLMIQMLLAALFKISPISSFF
jgi:hypothetical protein